MTAGDSSGQNRMYEEISTKTTTSLQFGKTKESRSENQEEHSDKERRSTSPDVQANMNEDHMFDIYLEDKTRGSLEGEDSSFVSTDQEEDDEEGEDGKTVNTDTSGTTVQREETDLSNEMFPQLSIDDVLHKMNDVQVTEESEFLEDIQNTDSEDLEKLQYLNRSNLVIRRLLANNRLTAREVKNTTIDPDIKSVVSEFLKTNVVGNFIISRVLRENYATFYSWLSTHLQCERNSWVVRLKQTLEQYETLRRDNIVNQDIIMDSAHKVDRMVRFCCQSKVCDFKLKNADEDSPVYSTFPSLQPLPDVTKKNVFSKKANGIVSQTSLVQQNKKSIVGSSLEASSTMNSRSVGNHGQTSFHLTTFNSSDSSCTSENSNCANNLVNSQKKVDMHLNISGQQKESKKYEHLKSTPYSPLDNEINGGTSQQPMFEDEDTKDWKEILCSSIQQLGQICESFVSERQECFTYLGAKTTTSLNDAMSAFVMKRHTSGQSKKREIEQRLCVLEKENKALIEEMTTLQSTLRDKQKDALNLQTQLDRLEDMLSSATCAKLNKCVGTDNTEQPVNNGISKQIEKVNQTPYRYKMILRNSPTQKGYKEKGILNNGRKESRDVEHTNTHALTTPTSFTETPSSEDNSNNRHIKYVREKSIIEISEEKLNVLKQRAQKLEHSLHDAITSMTLIHKEQSDCDTSSGSILNVTGFNSNRNNANKPLAKSQHKKGAAPRLAVIRRPASQGRSQSETLLVSEPTSFLTGRSLALTSQNTDRSLAQSCLTVMVDKNKSDIQTKKDYEQYIAAKSNSEHSTSKAAKVKVISRHRAAGNAMVSKCLRCQKLFYAMDNHKLACFYHTKEKERIEHYDQTGKLLRVTQAWMCCHQPQEIEGCCYGQHI
ncbi:hypothetical protein BgiMline_035410 [Biomphalaria glabrata]